MRKRVCCFLLALFPVLIVLALPLHLQKGLSFDDRFWRQTSADTLRCNGDNFFTFTTEENKTTFDLTLNGQKMLLAMTQTEDQPFRFESDEGWAMEPSNGLAFSYEIGGVTYHAGSGTLLVTDASSPIYRFAPCHFETSYYMDESGRHIGEHIDLVTKDGYHLSSYEVWYNAPENNTQLPEPILFENGLQITHEQASGALFVNAQGEYLTNAEQLLLVQTGPSSYHSKAALLRFLQNAYQGKAARRGDAISFVLFVPLYLWGLAMLYWPEKLAFFGSRWQFRYEPELSDAGLACAQLSAVFVMISAVIVLYLPLFKPFF